MKSAKSPRIKSLLAVLVLLASTILPLIPLRVYAVPSDRYWVGGSGNTNDTAHWDLHSGGAGGDAVPDSETNVYFDALSDSGAGFTVTVNAAFVCHDMDWSAVDQIPTFAGSSALTIYGSMILDPTMIQTYSGAITFASTGAETITSEGKSFTITTFSGVGGSWVLQDGWSCTTLVLTNGTLDTNGTTVNCGAFTGNAGTNALDLGASTINCTSWIATNLDSLTCGTSIIKVTGTGEFTGAGLTYYEVQLNGTAHTISGVNTFTNLTRTGTATVTDTLTIAADQVITGTLTIAGDSYINRLLMQSSVQGTTRNLQAATVSISNTDISDIWGTGAGSWDLSLATGGSGDCGGNTGITFTTPNTHYWVGGTGSWTQAVHWSATSGGAGWTTLIPLVQDIAVFDANSFPLPGATVTMTTDYRFSNIQATAVTNTPTFSAGGGQSYLWGSLAVDNLTWSNTVYFVGRGNCTITTNGTTMFAVKVGQGETFGKLTLIDDLTLTNSLSLYAGILDFNDCNVTTPQFNSTTLTFSRYLYMGSGTITLNGTTGLNKWTAGGFCTIYAETSTIIFTSTSVNADTFIGGGKTYNNFRIQGTGNYTTNIADANTFNVFTVDRSQAAKTISGAFTLTVSELSIPVSGNTVVTVSGTDFTKVGGGIVCVDWLDLTDSVASPVATFFAGTNSHNHGTNTNWSFTACALPQATTQDATDTTLTTATLNGTLVSLGDFTVVYGFFQYDQDGTFVAPLETVEQTLVGTGTVHDHVVSLVPSDTYYVRFALRYNLTSYVYGGTESFISEVAVPGYIPGYDPTAGVSTLPGADNTSTDALETTTTTDQNKIPVCGDLNTLPGYDIVHAIAEALTGTTMGYDLCKTETMIFYGATGIFVLVVCIGLLFLIPGHMLISGIGTLAAIGLAVSVSIFPWWAIVVAVIYFIVTIMQERTNWTG